MRSSAPTRCRRSAASSSATPDVELVWLTDGVDLGGGSEFVAALGRLVEQRPITVVEGGIAGRARAVERRQHRRRAHREGVARERRRGGNRHRARARPQGPAARRRRLQLSRRVSARPRPSSTLPVEIRNDIARLEIAGERSAGAVALARQALAPALDRRDHRLDRRHRAAAARLDLSISRARSVRSPTCGSPTAARRPSGEPVHRAAPADADPRRRRQRRRRRASSSPAGSRKAACWCALPARGSLPATTISCR